MKTEQVKKLLKPILSEANPRLHDKIKRGFYALRDWALEHPLIKEVEVTQFVKVPEVVKEIHHVEVVEKVVEKVVADPDQSNRIERMQKRIGKLEADIKTAARKCETSAAIAFLRFEITKHGLTNAAFDGWLDDLILLSLADCACIANATLSHLANSSDADIKATLGVSNTACRKAVTIWANGYFPDGLPQSDWLMVKHIIRERRPRKDNDMIMPSPEFSDESSPDNRGHSSWMRCWVAMGGETMA